MRKLRELIRSPHIHIALAAGASIILLALFSKRILKEPISDLAKAIPSFAILAWETIYQKNRESGAARVGIWIIIIGVLTACVIGYYWIR